MNLTVGFNEIAKNIPIGMAGKDRNIKLNCHEGFPEDAVPFDLYHP